MASSLGAAIGVAVSASIFTALTGDGSRAVWEGGMIEFVGRQDNLAVRQAAMVALGVNLVMVIAAIISIALTIPKQNKV